MSKIILLTLLLGFAAAAPEIPTLKPVFPEDASRSNRLGRIVNGWPASSGQFPHQVRLIAKISSIQNSVCGASIISDAFILTAAHCTRGFNSFNLGFGSTSFNNPSFSLTSTTKIEHSSYNPTNLNNDISLIALPVRLTWNTVVQPVQLPSYSQASQTFLGRQATVSGFGKTKDSNTQLSMILMFVYVRVIENSQCSALYGTDVVRAFTLCTVGWDSINQSTCHGDSGGPLVIFDETIGQNILAGVISFVSSRGCEAGDPAGFVRVTSYLDWIKSKTGIQIRP